MNRITLITVGLSIAACSSSNQATPEQYDATAQAIASTTATSGGTSGGGDVASMADSASLALGVKPLDISITGEGQFQATRLGVTYNYSLTCKNVAGVVSVCGPTTDQAAVSVSWSGNVTSENLDTSVTRNGDWTIAGLQTDTATFAGDSDFSFDLTLRGPNSTATYSFDASASYHAVRISTHEHKIIDGSASYDLAAHGTVTGSNSADASFEVHAELTFHADHTASLVLDGSQHYSLNLDTGVVVRVN